MIYSSACAYAIRALSWLALKNPQGYTLLDELCEQTDLPRHFLAKVFQDLVRAGVLVSARGRGGGFALARPADSIRLMEVVEAIDGTQALKQCVVGMARCNDEQPCPQHDQWKPLRSQIRAFLDETTLLRASETLNRKLELIGATSPAEALARDMGPKRKR
ncbi:Rrf2 family transcriptional regulator [Phycisphaerales bacterium AB-hyl4]|uniref:Rrf2 family transcriptional regulator n=1 Tax=Natronomicrosphaera hydrolytica TaxID=3242702 RepID=A0ABV4U7W9_9BACT